MGSARKSNLSAPRARLVECMQGLGFGEIHGLVVCEGEPILAPPPRIVRDVKFGSESGPRKESELSDFDLKDKLVDLFREFDRRPNGTICCLEIKHGLPFRMQIEEELK